MFVELMPLLADRTVMITVARVDNQTLRVHVIATESESDNPALSAPLSYTGAPAELDAELGSSWRTTSSATNNWVTPWHS